MSAPRYSYDLHASIADGNPGLVFNLLGGGYSYVEISPSVYAALAAERRVSAELVKVSNAASYPFEILLDIEEVKVQIAVTRAGAGTVSGIWSVRFILDRCDARHEGRIKTISGVVTSAVYRINRALSPTHSAADELDRHGPGPARTILEAIAASDPKRQGGRS